MICSPRIACFWPGLVLTWHQGKAQALFVAVAFAWVLCSLMLATFVWPEWFSTAAVRLVWVGVIAFWLWETVRSFLTWPRVIHNSGSSTSDERFPMAQDEYLRGNWFEAEALLLAILAEQPRDAESQLLLIGVLRHTRRWVPAVRRLEDLELLESANKWRFEISRERSLIAARMAEQKQIDDDPGSSQPHYQESTASD